LAGGEKKLAGFIEAVFLEHSFQQNISNIFAFY
jgi:hypothetical protein